MTMYTSDVAFMSINDELVAERKRVGVGVGFTCILSSLR